MQYIFEKFEHSCLANGSKTLFALQGRDDINFAEALNETRRIASALRTLGVTEGDRVAAQVDKSPEAVLLYLACLQIGAVFLPLNTAYKDDEINYFLGDSKPSLFVCRPEELELHSKLISSGLAVESLGQNRDGTLIGLADEASPSRAVSAIKGDDPAAILYTSGTTGRSKGAVLTHRNLASNTEALLEAWRFTSEDRLIHALPIFHTHGLFVACNMSFSAGATMVFMDHFNVDTIISEMKSATVLMGVPTFYTRLLQADRLTLDAVKNMRLFISGSAPLSEETHNLFKQRTGRAILERYGMTETCMITTNPYEGTRLPGAVGMSLPGVEVKIADRDTGQALSQGEIGSIEVRGPNVFAGYWQMPEKTASEFRDDGFFITGDVGTIDTDGYLRIVGRDKDLVISGGYNIYPKEIEIIIDKHPDVLESAVVGLPHPDLGEGVTAVVVPQDGSDLHADAVMTSLKDKIARYKQPKRVIVVTSLPRNVMGKVQKAELRKTYAELYRSR